MVAEAALHVILANALVQQLLVSSSDLVAVMTWSHVAFVADNQRVAFKARCTLFASRPFVSVKNILYY